MVTQEAAPTKAESEPPHVSDCPFVELSFFTEQTAAFFFGRDAERRTIMNNLRASRLTLLHAVSGTGKSSLLRAGVAHRLRELAKQNYRQRGTAGYLPVVCSSWTETPVVELVHQIETSIGTFFSEEDRPVLPQRLDLAITAASQLVDAKLLIMLDQFEEYSLYRPGDPSQGLLLEQLSYAINQPEIRANFLISIREDAYASLGDLFRGRVPNLYGNYLGLSKLSRKNATEAVFKPIERYNELHELEQPVAIEPALVEKVLNQVSVGRITRENAGLGTLDGRDGTDAIEAPFLQLVMTRLWETEQRTWEPGNPRMLRLSTLDQLGGAEQIVRAHLAATLGELPPKDRDVAADVLHHLVTPSGAKIAQNVPDLADYTHHSSKEIETVLERLAMGDARVLRKVDPPAGAQGGARYEIFHDVLAPAVLGWRQGVETARQLRQRVRRVLRLLGTCVLTLAIATGLGFAGLGIWRVLHPPTPADHLQAIIPVIPGVKCIQESPSSWPSGAEAAERCDYLNASGPIGYGFYALYPTDKAMNRAFSSLIPAPNMQGSCGKENAQNLYTQFMNNCVSPYGKPFGQLWEYFSGSGKSRVPEIMATSKRWSTIFEINGYSTDPSIYPNELLLYFGLQAAGSTNGFFAT